MGLFIILKQRTKLTSFPYSHSNMESFFLKERNSKEQTLGRTYIQELLTSKVCFRCRNTENSLLNSFISCHNT